MKRTITIHVLAVFLTAAAVSCSKQQNTHADDNRIRFSAKQENFHMERASTRADIITDLFSFSACITTSAGGTATRLHKNIPFTYDGGDYTSELSWPDDGAANWRFDCSNSTMTWKEGEGYTISADASFDTVVAVANPAIPKRKNDLTFRHIFGLLDKVYIYPAAGQTATDVSVLITPVTAGTYSIRKGEGHDDRTGWSDTVTGTPVNIAAGYPGICKPGLLLVPGTYQATASWTTTGTAGAVHISKMTSEIEIKGGRDNIVTIILDAGL